MDRDELDALTCLDVYGGYELKRADITAGCMVEMILQELTEIADTHASEVTHDQTITDRIEESPNPESSVISDELTQNTDSPDKAQTKALNVNCRRIVDIDFLWQQLAEKIGDHPCPFSDLNMKKLRDYGLKTEISIECEKCRYINHIWTDRNDDDMLGINASAVCGTLTSGIGCSTMQEIFASLGIHGMTQGTYWKYRNRFYEDIKNYTTQSMKAAVLEEAAIAVQKGHVINNIPYIRVIVDGAWAKRSSAGGKHDPLSGVAVIVGFETGKVLFIGVRNKYCAFEAKAEQRGKEPGEHVCFKDWGRDQSSTAMEKDIIVEGFLCSVEMHNLIYKIVIADGNAGTHQAIRDANPYGSYGVLVEKIECNNHLFRNLCKKIRVAAMMSISRTIHSSLSLTVTAF